MTARARDERFELDADVTAGVEFEGGILETALSPSTMATTELEAGFRETPATVGAMNELLWRAESKEGLTPEAAATAGAEAPGGPTIQNTVLPPFGLPSSRTAITIVGTARHNVEHAMERNERLLPETTAGAQAPSGPSTLKPLAPLFELLSFCTPMSKP
jgi:hypothetical protein